MQLLQDSLYEAIFIPEGVEPPAREIIYRPDENEEEYIMVCEL